MEDVFDESKFPSRRFVSIGEIARMTGEPSRRVLDRLKSAHKRYGGVLFRFSESRYARYYTTNVALRKLWPERFSEANEVDFIWLANELSDTQDQVQRLSAEIVKMRREFRRMSKEWFERRCDTDS